MEEMHYKNGAVVVPGNVVLKNECRDEKSRIIVGPGLRRFSNQLIVAKCGILRKKESPFVIWVDSHQKRYVPIKGDDVLGIITGKFPDYYRVDIGSNEQALMSCLAFEGATKRNKPNLLIGDLIFAKVVVANKDVEPELVCIDSQGKTNGLGPLTKGGFLFKVSLNLARKILSPNCSFLQMLGKFIPFEIAVGMNGKIWICAKTVKEIIVLVNAICLSEEKNDNEMKLLCSKVQDFLKGFCTKEFQ